MDTQNRTPYIDSIKAIDILMVIAGHVNFANGPIKGWIYAIHMPLFFFASGLAFRMAPLDRAYFQKRGRQLLIPWLLWSCIYAETSLHTLPLLLYGSHSSLTLAGSLSSLWFLPVMFLVSICLQLLFRLPGWYLRALVCLLAFAAVRLLPMPELGYPWGFNAAVYALPFALLGAFFSHHLENRWELSSARVCLPLIAAGLLLTAVYPLNRSASGGYVMLADGRIGNPLLFLTAAVGGCLAVYGISRLLRFRPLEQCLGLLGRNTLVIFAVHKLFIQRISGFLQRQSMHWSLTLLIAMGFALCGSAAATLFINFCLPWLAGRAQTKGHLHGK